MIRRPPRSTLFPTRRSSDLLAGDHDNAAQLSAGLGEIEGLKVTTPQTSIFYVDIDRKSTRLNSSLMSISYAVFCLKKKKDKKKKKEYINNTYKVVYSEDCNQ